MKRLMTVAVLLMVMGSTAWAYHPWNGITGTRHPWDHLSVGYRYSGGYYGGGYYGGGYYGGGYYGGGYYGNENVNVRYRERWDVQGGERSYEQSPKLEAKVIDAATILAALLIIFH